MKLSELIDQLVETLRVEGDMPVKVEKDGVIIDLYDCMIHDYPENVIRGESGKITLIEI